MSSLPWLLVLPPAPDETPAAAHELEPQRLVQQLYRAGYDPIDRETVDRILARGADCAPLLRDVLDAFAAGLIDDGDPLAARALALLGEIGDPSDLGQLALFFAEEDDEDAVSDAAEWAFRRIASRRPAEALPVIAELAATAEPVELSDLCKQIDAIPDMPGRTETLLGFAERLNDFNAAGRALVVANMIISAMSIDGPRGQLAASIRKDYGTLLTHDFRELLRALEAELIQTPDQPTEESSVYDVVCEGFDVEEPDEPFVREEPKLGRNDPCWCGSGKKYKKCHLAADEAR